jgi:hypothetical protein
MIGVAIAASLVAISGCDVGDLIRVKTPRVVQQAEGLSRTLTLNDAEAEYRQWLSQTKEVGMQWRNGIDRANTIRTTFNQLTLSFLDEIGPTVAGVPLLGPLMPGLTLLIGTLIKRPGDVSGKVLQKEKQDSYNAGLENGKALASST